MVEEIIVRINNNIITRADLKRAREQLLAEMHQQEPNATTQQEKDREKDLLRDLIDQQLLLQKGEELGISADTEVVKRLDELRKQMHADSMEELEKAAQSQGVSFEEFKQNMKNGIITQRVIGQEVGSHISVTQQEIQQEYDKHKAEMERPEEVRLSEILISTQTAPPVKTEKGKRCCPKRPVPRPWPRPRPKPTRFMRCCKRAASSTTWPSSIRMALLRQRAATWNTSSAARFPRSWSSRCSP